MRYLLESATISKFKKGIVSGVTIWGKCYFQEKLISVHKSIFNFSGKICKKEKFRVAHHSKFGTRQSCHVGKVNWVSEWQIGFGSLIKIKWWRLNWPSIHSKLKLRVIHKLDVNNFCWLFYPSLPNFITVFK